MSKKLQILDKKNLTIGVLAFALLLTSGLTVVSAANDNDEQQKPCLNGEHKGQHQKFHRGMHAAFMSDDLKAALEAGDYEKFRELLSEQENLPPKLKELSEEHFNHMVEVHKLMEAGEKEGLKELHEEWREEHKDEIEKWRAEHKENRPAKRGLKRGHNKNVEEPQA